jgi:hypothetical protein
MISKFILDKDFFNETKQKKKKTERRVSQNHHLFESLTKYNQGAMVKTRGQCSI